MRKLSTIQHDVIKQFLLTRKENEESFFAHPSYQLEQELLHWVTQADEEKARVVLSKINNLERARLSTNPLRSIKNSLICSCTLFTRATIKAGVTPEYAFDLSDIYIREIEKINHSNDLLDLEYEMVITFIKAVRDYRKDPYQNEIVDKAIHYIHDHILQPITLTEVAEATNVNPNYLSSLFSKIVGIPMKEYVNRKKIEESKYFLEHTSSSLLDIALLFGFSDQSYYTSLFRKYNGITPGKYKQLGNNSYSKK
ncbi:helix-turn-helix transcriptional regulator [Ornithinibacillus californiensis]|uniref:helix-turn-helix transcriptional regulator n=1 Tax=Ornithinibacillus californiensis TaxID=161536 RepID=UPI00064DECB2|nr:AraC family transcriptional regulator [Ornithinibacillus californiensis]